MHNALTPRLCMPGPLLTLEQAAALLGVTGSTLRQRIRAGHLHAFRHGRKHFITRKWLEQYRAERHRKPDRPRATRSLQADLARLVADAMGLDLLADFGARSGIAPHARKHAGGRRYLVIAGGRCSSPSSVHWSPIQVHRTYSTTGSGDSEGVGR